MRKNPHGKNLKGKPKEYDCTVPKACSTYYPKFKTKTINYLV